MPTKPWRFIRPTIGRLPPWQILLMTIILVLLPITAIEPRRHIAHPVTQTGDPRRHLIGPETRFVRAIGVGSALGEVASVLEVVLGVVAAAAAGALVGTVGNDRY